jgi:hypothetical protein
MLETLELKTLLEEVEKEKRLWSTYSFEPPEWWKHFTGEDNRLPSESEVGQTKKPSFPDLENKTLKSLDDLFKREPSQKSSFLSALELKEEQRKKDMELERGLNESELAVLASSLESLIATCRLYQQARSHR